MDTHLAALIILVAGAALGAGCLGGDTADDGGDAQPDTDTAATGPTDPDMDDTCPVCGMPTDLYDGPHGKILLSDGEEIAFCSTVDLFRVTTDPGFEDRGVAAVRVLPAGRGGVLDPEGGWIDARTAHYVAGSDRRAAMGRTLVPFGDLEDAERFAQRHGGTILTYDQIDRATLSRHTHY